MALEKLIDEIVVAKFGGTSLQDGESIAQAIGIIMEDRRRRVNVVSAPSGITNLLIKIGEEYNQSRNYPTELVNQVRERFIGIADYFEINHNFLKSFFDSLEKAVKNFDEDLQKYLDGINPWGEIINAALAAKVLRTKGINAKTYHPSIVGMVGIGKHGNA